MHIIPLHIGDWVQATAQFENVHLGIFVRLLTEYYKSEKALPDDDSELAWIAAAKTKSERDALKMVLRRCFTHHADSKTYIQKRADREIEKFHHNGLEKRYAILCRHWEKINGDLSKPSLEDFMADPSRYYDEATRHIRKQYARNTPVSSPNESSNNGKTDLNYYPVTSNQKPVTSNQNNTPIVPKGTDSAPPFSSDSSPNQPPEPSGQSEPAKKRKGARGKPQWTEDAKAIYLAYPRKIAAEAALRAIQKRLSQGIPAETLLQATTAYAAATAGTERQFIPHPATWFNAGRYLDDPAEWTAAAAAPTGKAKGFTPPQIGAAEILRDTAPPADTAPEGWQQAWSALTTAPVPDDWTRVSRSMQFQVIDYLDEKNREGDASHE